MSAENNRRLPVLLYHHVGPNRPNTYRSLTISPEKFERHVRWLANNGYHAIRPSDWSAYLRNERQPPDKPVMLTFDDAYEDLVTYAFPVLKNYGFVAAVFVVSQTIGGTNTWDERNGSGTHRIMTAGQIHDWANLGIEFGAHTRTHPDLTTLSATALSEEIEGSAEDLRHVLGRSVHAFAYPNGSHNAAIETCVRRAYDLAFTVEEGLNNARTDPYLLKRTMVQHGDSLFDLMCRVQFGSSPIHHLRAQLRVRSRIARALAHLHLAPE